MRLTLRTLLAYLDDILDPADKEELAQKIESSEFAEELVHRTRDTMRRLRLSAPQVIGSGIALDPNTVAEYLDNVLPPEQVGDYERICLESDVHLAEAAASHHVLTMVLGEPADVDPRSRQRMYMIPAEARERRRLRAEPAHTRATAATAAAAPIAAATSPAAAGQSTTTTVFELPEYLRTRSWWRSRGALVALAAVLVVGTGFYLLSGLMGWFGGTQDLAVSTPDAQELPAEAAPLDPQVEIGAPNVGTTPAETVVAEATPVAPSNPSAAGDRYPVTDANATSQPLATAPEPLTPGIEAAPTVTEESAEQNTESSEPVAASAAPGATTDPTAAPVIDAIETPSTDNAATVNVAPTSETESGSAVDPAATLPPQDAAVPPPGDVSSIEAPAIEPANVGDAAPIAAVGPSDPAAVLADAGSDSTAIDDAPPGPPEMGTYLSGKTVLLRYDEPTGGWFRIEPRSAVIAGQRLLALPEFRPKITLESGVHVDLSGGTQVFMAAGDDPEIEVLYGRIVLTNISNEENQVRLKLGSSVGDARLARNATLAVEVERQYVPGNDPRTTPAPVAVRLFVPDGGVTWRDAAGEIVVDKPSRWTIAQDAPTEVIADSAPPEWIDDEPALATTQQLAAKKIEESLVSDRPVENQLLESFQGTGKREIESLASRCCIYVGQFRPFVDALRDSDQRPNWKTHVNTLRSAMAHSPNTAEQVFSTLEEQRGRAAAADMYEMLCGYNAEQIGSTPEQLKAGALARLINWLEEESLDYRVLAVQNLLEITGKQLMPNPAERNLSERKKNIRNWRNRLENEPLKLLKRP